MRSIRKYIAGVLSAAMIMTSAFAQGAVVSYAEEQDVGIVATVSDAEEAEGVQVDGVDVETAIEEELEAQGDSGVTDSGLKYKVTDAGEITITGYSGTATELDIPDEIDGKKVVCIGLDAFNGCSALTSINIPESVSSIEQRAFMNCSGLTRITVDSLNTTYDSRNDCNAIIESNTDTLIAGCQNTLIPDSVTSIDSLAFRGCSGLTSISIPKSVTSISGSAFYGCDALTNIEVETGNDTYESRNGCNAIIEISTNTLILGCSKTVIPDDVTAIGPSAFSGCSNLTSINIPSGVTSIGSSAFSGCSNLTNINIPNGVTSINFRTFLGCSSMTSISIPDGVTQIGSYAFEDCSGLTSIRIPDGVTCIEDFSFLGCSGLTSISIPDSVTKIEDYAFGGCSSATSIRISNNLTYIGEQAFGSCSSLTSISVPSSLEYIGVCAFRGCDSLTSIKVDAGNKVFDSRNDCNAIIRSDSNILRVGCKNTVIPDSVTGIDFDAFAHCNSLTSITIPNGVTRIEDFTFMGCSNLTSVTIPTSVTSIGQSVFMNCDNIIINCYNNSTAHQYALANNIPFNILAEKITINPSTKTISKGETVTLAATVTPSEATDKTVTWKSDNTKVATVDEKTGKVTAVAKGTANITCTAADESGVTATCKITVTQPVTNIKLNASSKTIAKGKSVTLKATVKPSNATDKTVTWKSSNTKVAKVDKKTGKITAKKVGTATITCTSADGKTKATCKITVTTPVTKVKLNKTKATLKKGKSVKLKATVTPTKAYKKVIWKSSNTKVATVSSSGKVTAKKKGTATITCTAADGSGKKVTCKITVK